MLGYLLRHIPELSVFGAVFALHCVVAFIWLRRRGQPAARQVILALGGLAVSFCLLCGAFFAASTRVNLTLPWWVTVPVRAMGLAWAGLSVTALGALALRSAIPRPEAGHSPSRRAFLKTARGAVLSAPAIAGGYGVFIERKNIRVTEFEVRIPGLPLDLDGLRLVQLTDIHLSPYLSRSDLRRAVEMANETKAHVALVTGDLITSTGDPLDDCLVELAMLRSDAGIVGCHGNHENYARCTGYATREGAKLGIEFLRQQSKVLRFGTAQLNLVGVDYQVFRQPYLTGAERLARPDALNVLLSHNPDVFPVAARKGFQMTIAGHTHGGQITAEILDQNLSIARFYTPYVYGLYQQEGSSIVVGRGIGTVGIPARLGAPPEVASIRLCAT